MEMQEEAPNPPPVVYRDRTNRSRRPSIFPHPTSGFLLALLFVASGTSLPTLGGFDRGGAAQLASVCSQFAGRASSLGATGKGGCCVDGRMKGDIVLKQRLCFSAIKEIIYKGLSRLATICPQFVGRASSLRATRKGLLRGW